MTKRELLQYLAKYDEDMEVMILDEPNGNYGSPRIINFGPVMYKIQNVDAGDCCDCEGKVGQEVILIGFGSY